MPGLSSCVMMPPRGIVYETPILFHVYFYPVAGMLTTNPLIAFVITLAFITINSLQYRSSPFFPLMGGAVPGLP